MDLETLSSAAPLKEHYFNFQIFISIYNASACIKAYIYDLFWEHSAGNEPE